MGFNPWVRANMMPEWVDHGLALPPGVEARRDGDFAALIFGPKHVGLRVSTFDPAALPEFLRRLGVSGRAPARLAE